MTDAPPIITNEDAAIDSAFFGSHAGRTCYARAHHSGSDTGIASHPDRLPCRPPLDGGGALGRRPCSRSPLQLGLLRICSRAKAVGKTGVLGPVHLNLNTLKAKWLPYTLKVRWLRLTGSMVQIGPRPRACCGPTVGTDGTSMRSSGHDPRK
jgi:hypothetical protein